MQNDCLVDAIVCAVGYYVAHFWGSGRDSFNCRRTADTTEVQGRVWAMVAEREVNSICTPGFRVLGLRFRYLGVLGRALTLLLGFR